jgi:hypothetical protein
VERFLSGLGFPAAVVRRADAALACSGAGVVAIWPAARDGQRAGLDGAAAQSIDLDRDDWREAVAQAIKGTPDLVDTAPSERHTSRLQGE